MGSGAKPDLPKPKIPYNLLRSPHVAVFSPRHDDGRLAADLCLYGAEAGTSGRVGRGHRRQAPGRPERKGSDDGVSPMPAFRGLLSDGRQRFRVASEGRVLP